MVDDRAQLRRCELLRDGGERGHIRRDAAAALLAVALAARELDEVVRSGRDTGVYRRVLAGAAVAVTFPPLVSLPPLATIPITPPTPTRMAATRARTRR